MTLENYIEAFKGRHGLTMKDLRQFVMENPNIPGDALVCTERIEDRYFENHGWNTFGFEGHSYRDAIKFNENVVNGEFDDNIKTIPKEELENFKDRFFQSWCISNIDDKIVLIYNHY